MDPERKLVFLLGADGLRYLIGKPGYDLLVEMGYSAEFIRHQVKSGAHFKLIVFSSDDGEAVRISSWDQTIELVAQTYPSLREKLYQHLEELKRTPFEEIQRQAGFNFM